MGPKAFLCGQIDGELEPPQPCEWMGILGIGSDNTRHAHFTILVWAILLGGVEFGLERIDAGVL